MATTQTTDIQMLDDRDARALTECLFVYPDDPAAISETEVAVYSERGERYIVDPLVGFCTCDDQHYRKPDGGCKHRRRVEFEVGVREIPDWADRDRIDPRLGEQLPDDHEIQL